MHKFLREFITEWRGLGVPSEAPVIAAVSGGADSCAMLGALTALREDGKIKNELIAAHFNHALRGEESDADEDFVRVLSSRLGVRYLTERLEPGDSSGNLEQALRDSRYGFLHKIAEETGSNSIATGHTINDQAETLIMNLVRGSGLEGLSGMPAQRVLSPGSEIRLLRPMLRWARRSMTEEFCASRNIAFRYDTMNDDISLSRIKIRNRIIPELEVMNPKIIETLSRTTQSLDADRNTLNWLFEQNQELSDLALSSGLSVKALIALPASVRATVVRKWLFNRLGSLRKLGAVHLEAVESLATGTKSGKTVELPGKLRVVKNSGLLTLLPSKVEK